MKNRNKSNTITNLFSVWGPFGLLLRLKCSSVIFNGNIFWRMDTGFALIEIGQCSNGKKETKRRKPIQIQIQMNHKSARVRQAIHIFRFYSTCNRMKQLNFLKCVALLRETLFPNWFLLVLQKKDEKEMVGSLNTLCVMRTRDDLNFKILHHEHFLTGLQIDSRHGFFRCLCKLIIIVVVVVQEIVCTKIGGIEMNICCKPRLIVY